MIEPKYDAIVTGKRCGRANCYRTLQDAIDAGATSIFYADQSGQSQVGSGIGCLFICIGIVLIIWALQGFPGLR